MNLKIHKEKEGKMPPTVEERNRFSIILNFLIAFKYPCSFNFVSQAVTRSNQRSLRLQDALRNARSNAALMEELMAWLVDCHALLSAKERDKIPEDLTIIETLNKEHMVS